MSFDYDLFVIGEDPVGSGLRAWRQAAVPKSPLPKIATGAPA